MSTIGHRLRRPEKRGEEEQEATLHKRSCQRHSRRCSGNLDAQSMIHGCVWRKKRGVQRDPMISCLQDRGVQRLIRRALYNKRTTKWDRAVANEGTRRVPGVCIEIITKDRQDKWLGGREKETWRGQGSGTLDNIFASQVDRAANLYDGDQDGNWDEIYNETGSGGQYRRQSTASAEQQLGTDRARYRTEQQSRQNSQM
ncbi:hypothetical protein EMCG_05216 [[Emmonsia] crescens]|uniref:Uncharacterized protein n=1 Tax=[Emmonsia] crescens TaxID=73230 RepID=A0A0G2IXW0_9EURO|nr:hypothetical protein EMCG_05216 [Emmonsia crescens UAMH 3008]